MHQTLHLILWALLLPLCAAAQTTRTITLAEAGTLSQHIAEEEKYAITHLTVVGPLNGTDFRLLRDMAGNDWQGQLTAGQLHTLNLSEAHIVAGGENYLETTDIYIMEDYKLSKSSGFIFTTEADVVPQWGFVGCNSLADIRLPQSAIAIGEYAFHTGELEAVTLGQNLRSIARNAFYHNIRIATLTLPATLTNIDANAFNYCEGLREVYASMEIPFSISTNTFAVYTKATLYVPRGTHALYASTPAWNSFEQIEEFDAPSTGIMSPTSTVTPSDVYTLSGQKMPATSTTHLPQGVYVMGNKKVLIK